MTAARRPARRRTRRPRSRPRPLPNITTTTSALGLILYAGALRAWPIPVGILTAAVAATLITLGIRHRSDNQPHSTTPRVSTPRTSRDLATFRAMSPTQFEHAIAALACQHPAVQTATVHGRTADRGLDVLVQMRDGRRILVQCKRWAGNVGGGIVREIVGSVLARGCTAGVIVTTAGFTREALATNATLGPHRLTLVDGPTLVRWANGGHAPWQ